MMFLDVKNRKILGYLMKDARMPVSELAKKVMLSRQMVKQRIDNLVKDKIIKSFETRLSFEKLGFKHFELFFSFKK